MAAAVLVVAAVGLAGAWASRRLSHEDPGIPVTGSIEGTQVDVSSRVSARILERVQEGQPVERGQLVARLDATDLDAEVSRAQAALATAEAQRRDLEAGARPEEVREAEARAARAEAQLADLLAGSRRQELEQARAGVRNARATRQWAEQELGRAHDLFGKELVAKQEVDRARQAYEVAAANETTARERLALLEAGPRRHEVEAARAELRAAREHLALVRAGPRPETVAATRAQVAQARAALAFARAKLADTRLLAPIRGVVLRKNLEIGETANPGSSIVTLLDPHDLWLRAYVPETDVGRISVGQRVRVSVDAFPGRDFPGAITEIASEAEFTPKNVQTKKERVNLVFRIKIGLENRDGVLKPGLPADAVIETSR